jgi:hypothetical protein
MGSDWALYVFVFVIAAIVLARLGRLGKQLEAVCALIRADVASNEDDRNEIMDDWKQAKIRPRRHGSSGFSGVSSALRCSLGTSSHTPVSARAKRLA